MVVQRRFCYENNIWRTLRHLHTAGRLLTAGHQASRAAGIRDWRMGPAPQTLSQGGSSCPLLQYDDQMHPLPPPCRCGAAGPEYVLWLVDEMVKREGIQNSWKPPIKWNGSGEWITSRTVQPKSYMPNSSMKRHKNEKVSCFFISHAAPIKL